jgi:hypothetical protein
VKEKAVSGPNNLPKAIADLAAASNAADMARFLSVWTDDALISDSHRQFWGKQAIRRWSSLEWIGDHTRFAEIRTVTEHYGDYLIEAVVAGEHDAEGLPGDYLVTFNFRLQGERISRMIILNYDGRRLGKMTATRMASTCFSAISPDLKALRGGGLRDAGTPLDRSASAPPAANPVITRLIEDWNRANREDFLENFADDALFNDKNRYFWGKNSIGAWFDAEIAAPSITIKPINSIDHYGDTILMAEAGGGIDLRAFNEFVVNSLVNSTIGERRTVTLALYVSIKGGKIVQLVITPVDGAWPIATKAEPFYVPYPPNSRPGS